MDLKRGDRIRVKEGIYTGKEYDVIAIAENALKSIGVALKTEDAGTTCWFKPSEVEKLND